MFNLLYSMKKNINKVFETLNFLVEKRMRMNRLKELREMLCNFYLPYSKRVGKDYSRQEQTLLIRIVEYLIFQLKDTPHYSKYGAKHLCDQLIVPDEWQRVRDSYQSEGSIPHFRLELDAVSPFTVSARLHCLQHLDEALVCFFYFYGPITTGESYLSREQRVLAKVIRIFVHQLRGTSGYRRYAIKRSPKSLSEAEMQELAYQKKDEVRLQFVRITLYNPLSEKYKAEKEKVLQRIRDMDSK